MEIRTVFSDLGLGSLVKGLVTWEGDHVRLILRNKESKQLDKEKVSSISKLLRKIGCRCVLDETEGSGRQVTQGCEISCSNRFSALNNEDQEEDLEENITQDEPVSVGEAYRRTTERSIGGRAFRGLRVGTSNFSGLCSSRKRMEISEVLVQNNIDVLAGQESL